MSDLNIHYSELEDLLKSGKLKYVTTNDGNLYEYEDLILREEIKDIWKKQRSAFSAKKYWLKPNIKPGSIFSHGTFNDVWIRFNKSFTKLDSEFDGWNKEVDTRLLILRKGSHTGKDIIGNEYYLWETEWVEFVMNCSDSSWERIQPKILVEDLTDELLFKLCENPPLYKSNEEILNEIENLSLSIRS